MRGNPYPTAYKSVLDVVNVHSTWSTCTGMHQTWTQLNTLKKPKPGKPLERATSNVKEIYYDVICANCYKFVIIYLAN